MKNRRIFIVANLFAGKKKVTQATKEVAAFLESEQIDFQLHDTNDLGNATATVSKKLDDSFTDLIILGGDGTINEAVNGLKYDIPVSVIPAGTGNDFIKNVAIGKSRKEQVFNAVHGEVKKLDLGQCNERIFVNGVGIGFDGQIVEDMITKRVPLLSGHAAYYYHVLRILGSYRERSFNYTIDKEQHSNDLILLTIGNGTTFGGGFKLMPEAKVDDGLLEICEVGKLSPLRRFLNIHRLSNGTHGELNEVNFHMAKDVFVTENPNLYAHIDGEWMGQPPFKIKVLPKALQLRIQP